LNELTAKRIPGVGIAPTHIINGPRIATPNRGHLLMQGSLSNLNQAAALIDNQTPNLWWPQDRAWFVASEIDYSWTYVAGSHEMLAALLDHPKLEVLQAERHHGCTANADTLNT